MLVIICFMFPNSKRLHISYKSIYLILSLLKILYFPPIFVLITFKLDNITEKYLTTTTFCNNPLINYLINT